MEKIIDEIMECKEKFEKIPKNKKAQAVSREEFTLLLSGISTCRKMPGVSIHMGIDPQIMAFLYADIGRKYGKDKDGWKNL